MTAKKTVLAICGSTRTSSTNLNYIKAIKNLCADSFNMTIYEGLAELPHFNPDLDTEQPPKQVANLRAQLRAADAVLICTPEYAMGVPGSLKNAIDWTVSSMEFSNKPTALITASSVGQKGHASLLETLKIIEAKITNDTQLLIPFAKTKINADCIISHPPTLTEINTLLAAFTKLI
jgi:NAD(P)H-dependent FMN reductase